MREKGFGCLFGWGSEHFGALVGEEKTSESSSWVLSDGGKLEARQFVASYVILELSLW